MASNDPKSAQNHASPEAEALAAQYHQPLLRYFERRVKTTEDAEELTQEVFVRLLRRPEIEGIENLEGFVFITAANLLRDYYRHRARLTKKGMRPIYDLDLPSSAPNQAQIVEDRADLNVLLAAIEKLPVKCRAVFVMHRFDELPHTEIARRMNVTVSMVEKHIALAMKQLRAALKDGGA